MLFEYRYFGSTTASSTPVSSAISFSPDTRRDPTFLTGKLRRKLPFRETISALHAVVVSDLRFQPRDRTAYLAWRAQQDQLDLAELAAAQRENADQIAAIRAELDELRRRQQSRWGAFRTAQKRFFDWLFRKNLDAWFVLDPVITVHPDEVAFECFSQDESSYGRLACSHEVFERLGELAYGTTNVDYSHTLFDEFQKIRDDKETSLQVDPAGFEVQSGEDAAYREVKIDLPDSWVRGFLQVTTAMMVLPGAVRLRLHPMDVHNLCFVLRRHKEVRSPRSLRFVLEPGRPVRVKIEPFDVVLDCPRSSHDAASPAEVRIWGRRRLLVLERLIPVARSFTVVLIGSGMPSFWTADCGDLTFTLGLSGWTANDWSRSGNFDLLAPRADVDADTALRAFDALRARYRASSDELTAATGLDRGTVDSAMVAFTQAGRAVYDLHNGVWRLRELSREPLDLGRLRWANPREAEAAELARSGRVQVRASAVDGHVSLLGRVDGYEPRLVLDADRRLVSGECACRFHFQNRLRQGPCEHLLAVRLAHERQLAAPWVDAPPPPPRPAPPPATSAVTAVANAVGRLFGRKPARRPRPTDGYDLDEEPNEAGALSRWRGALALADRVRVDADQGDGRIRGTIGTVPLWIEVRDGMLVDATCGCVFARQTRLRNGPCDHMYALWFAHRSGAASAPAAPRPAPVLEPWLPPVESGATSRGDPEGFVRRLEERKLVELDPEFRADFVRGVDHALSGRAAVDVRARRIWQLLESSVAVREFYLLDEQDLVALLQEWG